MSYPRDELDQRIVEEENQAQGLVPAELAPDANMPANFDMNTVPLADDYDSAVALQDAALGGN